MNHRQRGVALLMVLLILALMMVLASAMTERTARLYQQTATTLDNLQAKWYALGAETMAAALLQRDALDSPNQTHLAQNWAQEGRRFTVNDGEINATITDGQACFNLNAINHGSGEESEAIPWPARAFTRLLENLGEEPLRALQLTAALRDWIDGDREPRLNGGEDEVYMARSPGYLAANQKIQDVSELRLIAGMDAALYLRLLPFVCALPDDALQLNVNTLRVDQAPLLMALFPTGVNLQQARQLLQDRPRSGWNSVAAFLALPALQQSDTAAARPWLTVHSQRFVAAFTVVMGSTRYQQRSVLQKKVVLSVLSSGIMDSIGWPMNHDKTAQREMLIVRLAAPERPVAWRLVCPGDPQREACGEWSATGADATLPELAQRYPAWVLVPASDCAFHHVTLPAGLRKAPQQVVPFYWKSSWPPTSTRPTSPCSTVSVSAVPSRR